MNLFESWEVVREPKFVSEARDRARGVLTGWGLLDDDILLMLTELLTNALVHGEGRIFVSLSWNAEQGRLTCAVGDGGNAPTTPWDVTMAASQQDDDLAENGRGLAIVDMLADEWGVTSGPDGVGKAVWFCRRPGEPVALPGDHRITTRSTPGATA
ncbi:hypothetical protein GCM10010106_38400 [Thermopolyspora flexuosa]|jgi:anti-sigma regulatory factor (Ser/Thr protein kinase)|uniref:Anti-sigma regulatory factor (Ser/Thr protein kinase) n=1 Tax=Thermopolyspora flexuosa TaxID=103836 RepID=A0A543J237_9ACTN|nr:ATP-binding protein [Thermopolyspora flexuosa]TQM76880.1 anti-sigma regulatory factor (Ser/Thr protein kinase) [Thermopolyspora flexuosa]GGM87429.1 hypothetical protein GCM10010106_38400 [Thermopolyspora flexuosa]